MSEQNRGSIMLNNIANDSLDRDCDAAFISRMMSRLKASPAGSQMRHDKRFTLRVCLSKTFGEEGVRGGKGM